MFQFWTISSLTNSLGKESISSCRVWSVWSILSSCQWSWPSLWGPLTSPCSRRKSSPHGSQEKRWSTLKECISNWTTVIITSPRSGTHLCTFEIYHIEPQPQPRTLSLTLWSVLPISHITQWPNTITTEERLIIRDNLIEYFLFFNKGGLCSKGFDGFWFLWYS